MRLLVVVAHPDDESFGCGSVLARAATNRYDTAVVCATLGEAGESRIETDDLAALRESELRVASGILGVGLIRLLGHVDSGMAGDPPPGASASIDPALLAGCGGPTVIDEPRPDVVVTLDASETPRHSRRNTDRHGRQRTRRDRDLPRVSGSFVDDPLGRPHADDRRR